MKEHKAAPLVAIPPLSHNAAMYSHLSRSTILGGKGQRTGQKVSRILDIAPQAQYHNAACGPACLSMVLSYLGHEVSQQTLDQQIQSKGVGTPIRKIIQAASLYNVASQPLHNCTFEQIKEYIDAGLPLIAEVSSSRKFSNMPIGLHYVVIHGYKNLYNYRDVIVVTNPWMAKVTSVDFNTFDRDYWGHLLTSDGQKTGLNRYAVAFYNE